MQSTIELQAFISRGVIPQSDEAQVVYVMVIATPQGLPVARTRPSLNLSLVLDRSSSMRGERLDHVKEAAECIIDSLEPNDFISLVSFNDFEKVVIPSLPVENKANLKDMVKTIEADGGTEMARGLNSAFEEVQKNFLTDGINHMILLTDGQTYGDEERCLQVARMAHKKGIGLTAIGIGNEWNEDLLEMMTANENSHTRYITSAYEITNVFNDEVTRMSSTFAHNVQIMVVGQSRCTVRSVDRVQPYIANVKMKEDRKVRWLGNLGNWPSTDVHAFLVETVVPPLSIGRHQLIQIVLRYRLHDAEDKEQQCETSLYVDVKKAAQARIAEVDVTIKHWLERLMAYRLQERAWHNVQTGNINQAVQQLTMAGTRLLNAGESKLASTVQEEAGRLLESGRPSSDGRKHIKLGTRGLARSSLGEKTR